MRRCLCAILLLAWSAPGFADPLTLTYDAYTESKTLLAPIDAASPVRLDGLLPNRGGGSLTQSLTFVAGSSDMAFSAGWRTAPNEIRTVGVNIDLFDFNNALIFSDTFGGINAGLAQSQFSASGLIAGAKYTLLFTGTAIQGGRYQVDIAPGVGPLAIPPTSAITTPATNSLFDTLTGSKVYTGSLTPGDGIVIDGIFSESGAITNFANLAITGDTLSAGIEWLVAPGNQRTVGVNVDVFDFLNNLVISDSFMGVTNGQAFSNFAATGLTPGNYKLVFTGTAQQGGRYRINLGTSAVAPGFEPIPTSVPEPRSWAMLLGGFLFIGLAARRHKAPGRRRVRV